MPPSRGDAARTRSASAVTDTGTGAGVGTGVGTADVTGSGVGTGTAGRVGGLTGGARSRLRPGAQLTGTRAGTLELLADPDRRRPAVGRP
ncbi:hypothetical protein GCM10009866_33060 [Cellulomonas aerilata]